MTQEKPCLYFPMEIIEREMNGNVLLALEALRNNWQCVIGTKKSIFDNAHNLPPGLVFLKSIMSCEILNIKKLKKAGHKLVCLDVEGLVYTSMEEFVTVRFCPETLAKIEKLFFWGNIQKNAVAQAYPSESNKFIATGSPISELWTDKKLHAFYNDDVQALKDRFGPYIIIPSSFGTVNHYMGYEATLGIMQRDKMLHEDDEKEFFEFWSAYEAHVLKIFKSFLALLPDLSKAFPDHKILIRPHPSESHDTWKEAAKGLDNVEVLFEGSVSPWLLGADAILHWGCTTGLEAHIMGKPVVAYNPVSKEERVKFDHKLPQSISAVTNTVKETLNTLAHVIDNPDTIEAKYPSVAKGKIALQEWLCASEDGASAEVFSHFKELGIEKSIIQPLPAAKTPLKEHIWSVLGAFGKIKPVQACYSERVKLGIESRAYGKHKTKDIELSVLETTLSKLAEIKGVSGIKAQNISTNLFLLSRE